jgi:hypothetical protein
MTVKQRSNIWRQLRLGDVTASRFKDVMSNPRPESRWKVERPHAEIKEWWVTSQTNRKGPFAMRILAEAEKKQLDKADREGMISATADSYLNEKLHELLTGQPADLMPGIKQIEWGNDWEASAFEAAIPICRDRFGEELELAENEYAYCEHPTERAIGCSPDGIIGADGLLELKCPYQPGKHVQHIRYLHSGLPSEYKPQVQGSLWVTGRQWYLFASFDGRFPEERQLVSISVQRDDVYIARLAERVIAFRDRVQRVYEELTGVAVAPF